MKTLLRSCGFAGLGWSLALAVLTEPGASAASNREPDIRRDAVVEAVQRVMPCVVNVGTEEVVYLRDPLEGLFREFFDPYYRRREPNTQFSLGSGVIIDEEGYVLTNFHVVNRAKRTWVKLMDGREFECEKVSGTSLSDVALLKIKAPKGEKFSAVRFAADDDLLLGETVLALGNPFGLGASVSRGILSSKSRRPPSEGEPLDVPDWLQTDAAINPGNSGGPLVNLRGDLIGINVAIHREGEGIGFAVPVKRVAQAISDIYSPESIEKLWFGARVRPGSQPLQVMAVQIESPAGKAGLRAGDLILTINGRTPKGFIEFMSELLAAKDQRDVVLVIQRGTEQRKAAFRLVAESSYFNSDLIRRKIGATVQELSRELARGLGLPRVAGILVADVDKGSPAGNAELQRGMVIRSIDGQETDDIVAAARILHGRAKGDRVKLDLIIPIQRGAFVRITQAAVEMPVR